VRLAAQAAARSGAHVGQGDEDGVSPRQLDIGEVVEGRWRGGISMAAAAPDSRQKFQRGLAALKEGEEGEEWRNRKGEQPIVVLTEGGGLVVAPNLSLLAVRWTNDTGA
jgi:hypothetical protein